MEMTEREQILEMVARYGKAIDEWDYDAIDACFATDARVEFTGYSNVLEGRAAISAHMKMTLAPIDVMQHLFTNFIVTVNGASADLDCYILAQHIRNSDEGRHSFLAGAKYKAGLVKRDGAWQFHRLLAQTVWSEGNREMLPTAAR